MILQTLLDAENPLIIHHWDADGIAAAAILAKQYNKYRIYVPPIGQYRLTPAALREIQAAAQGTDLIAVLDYAIPHTDIKKLEDLSRPVAVIDHHPNTLPPNPLYHNPVARGQPQHQWPATAHVLATLLNTETPLAPIGIAGDLEEKALQNRVYRELAARLNLNPRKPLKAARLLDAPHTARQRKLIETLPPKLAKAPDPIQAILGDPRLREAERRYLEELARVLAEKPRRHGPLLLLEFQSTMLLASRVARRLHAQHPRETVAALQHDQETGQTHLYIRSPHNLTPLIRLLRQEGYTAGGKNHVLAVQASPQQAWKALKTITEKIKRR